MLQHPNSSKYRFLEIGFSAVLQMLRRRVLLSNQNATTNDDFTCTRRDQGYFIKTYLGSLMKETYSCCKARAVRLETCCHLRGLVTEGKVNFASSERNPAIPARQRQPLGGDASFFCGAEAPLEGNTAPPSAGPRRLP